MDSALESVKFTEKSVQQAINPQLQQELVTP